VSGSPDKAASFDRGMSEERESSNYFEIREALKELERGIHSKDAMLKMMVLKCGDNASSLKKVKTFINKGDPNNADKY
jgi:hypothetical protein